MTGIEQKAVEVEGIFADLQEKIASFRQQTGMHCKEGCGNCCTKPDIEATVLEFLPLAISLYKRNLTDEFLQRIEDRGDDPTCILFKERGGFGGGSCIEYPYRGLICRLFGYSARIDKHGSPVLVTCRIIKEEFPQHYHNAMELLRTKPEEVPLLRNFFYGLTNIDHNLSDTYYPINKAIRLALEYVGRFFAYYEMENTAPGA